MKVFCQNDVPVNQNVVCKTEIDAKNAPVRDCKILITGATGFIGRHVVEYLLANNYSLITTSIEQKEDAVRDFPLLKDTEYISKDLNDRENNYFDFFEKPNYLIHLSWANLHQINDLLNIEQNLFTDYYFIKNMVSNGLKDVAISGTCFEYGMQNGCLHENMPTFPNTNYGLAKDTLRKFVTTLQNQYEFTMKWLRLFYPYGHGQAKKSLWSQMEDAIINKQKEFNMSSGEQVRDFIPVKLCAEYISRTALQDMVTGIINCCSGNPITVRSFVEQFFQSKNYDITLNRGFYPLPDYEPFAFWGNTSKLKSALCTGL
jgi:dTDP-6-deoxy-L-talose 4-dehydrogenase (NAD+)